MSKYIYIFEKHKKNTHYICTKKENNTIIHNLSKPQITQSYDVSINKRFIDNEFINITAEHTTHKKMI